MKKLKSFIIVLCISILFVLILENNTQAEKYKVDKYTLQQDSTLTGNNNDSTTLPQHFTMPSQNSSIDTGRVNKRIQDRIKFDTGIRKAQKSNNSFIELFF